MSVNREKEMMQKMLFGVSCMVSIMYAPIMYGLCNIDSYDYYNCNITKINYPKKSSLFNDTHWRKCNCGKKCTAYTPTIDMYATIKDITNKSLLIRKNKAIFHTFYNSSCSKTFNLKTIETYLNNSQYIYNKYINNTIRCYYDNDNNNIYLDDTTFHLELIIILSCIVGLCWSCAFYCCCCSK